MLALHEKPPDLDWLVLTVTVYTNGKRLAWHPAGLINILMELMLNVDYRTGRACNGLEV